MNKLKAYCFDFPNGNMYCVGSDWAINDLYNNFMVQKEKNNSIEFKRWYDRIINNKIYCRFEPKNIHGIYMLLIMYLKLKKEKRWIKENDFTEALFLTNPEKISNILDITEIEADNLKKETIWKNTFLY